VHPHAVLCTKFGTAQEKLRHSARNDQLQLVSVEEEDMVTIYTERGVAGEVLAEKQTKPFYFGRMMAISLGTALLLSLVAVANLSADVKVFTDNCCPYIQQRLSEINPASLTQK
jgi:hypothetical protein